LSATLAWFEAARPDPSSKHFHAQTGVHFEEVAEMVDEIRALDAKTTVLLHEAKVALKALATHLKASDHVITVEPEHRVKFLDSLCDQQVTAVGVGYLCGFPMVDAMDEVNGSLFSKFVDGNAIYNENMKIMKGPYFYEPALDQFIPKRIPLFDDAAVIV
jgi:hypothetical protein